MLQMNQAVMMDFAGRAPEHLEEKKIRERKELEADIERREQMGNKKDLELFEQ